MKTRAFPNEDLLKNWYQEDLIEALKSARQRAEESWTADGSKMWAERAEAYAAELNRRYEANK
jgi:hypothetical protein